MFRFQVSVAVAILCFAFSQCRPLDDEEPTKFQFSVTPQEKPVDKSSGRSISSTFQDGKELHEKVSDAVRLGKGRLVNSILIARNVVADRVEEFMSETKNNVAGFIAGKGDLIIAHGKSMLQSYEKAPFAKILPPRTRETVRLEDEKGQAFFEKSKPNPIGSLLESILKPTPLVDKISEEEKYGNSGDRFIGVGRALVNGVEGLSNFLNAIVEIPVDAAKKTSRGLTEALNQIGSRLIGLQ